MVHVHYGDAAAAAAAAAAKSLQSCLTLCDPIDGSPPGSPHSWDSPGKDTGVRCHLEEANLPIKPRTQDYLGLH